ncbi:MAG: hypothetical protein GY906_09175 [bacterium]|nr:hypothetical protein [bacterium]
MKHSIMQFAFAVLIGQLGLGCCLCRPDPELNAGPPAKYAVLASTEMATPGVDVDLNAVFWDDLVLTYCTLLEQGFTSENTFVLYGEGQDHISEMTGSLASYCGGSVPTSITDIPLNTSTNVSKDNLCNVLCCLSTGYPAKMNGSTCGCRSSGDTGIGGFTCSQYKIPQLREEDFLSVWVKGHGSTSNCDTSLNMGLGYALSDSELQGLIEALEPERRVLLFETCNSGGWLDDLKDHRSVVVASSGDPNNSDVLGCQEGSFHATYDAIDANSGAATKMLHGRFTYWINATLRNPGISVPQLDSDTDGNNLVSVDESFIATKDQIDTENLVFDMVPPPAGRIADLKSKMHPAIEMTDGIASCLHIRLAIPGKDDEVFGMDHPEDNSIVPSVADGGDPQNSPDLWVRHTVAVDITEGGTDPPIAGEENQLYARIYNIGCANPGQITVSFHLKTCGADGLGDKVAEKVVNGPPRGESKIVNVTWFYPPNSAGNPQCIVGVLETGNDQPSDTSSIAEDNNKFQKTITID